MICESRMKFYLAVMVARYATPHQSPHMEFLHEKDVMVELFTY